MDGATHDQPASSQQEDQVGPKRGRFAARLKWLAVATLVGVLLFAGRQLPLDAWIEASRDTIEGLGIWGPIAFGAIYITATVLMVPGVILTLAAGALFGSLLGTAVVSLSSVTGAALAFLIARHLARERVEQRLSGNPRFAAIDRAIGEQGWQIVGLLRLSPAMPFSLSNYLYGLTAVRFWPYVFVSAVAMLPATFLYVYLGDVGARGVEAAVGAETAPTSAFEWGLRLVGLLATVAVTLYVTRIARRAIHEQTSIDAAEGDEIGSGEVATSGDAAEER
jgi:uncharacterized membrane protein YdjX (TVP38/TMEM64 family)